MCGATACDSAKTASTLTRITATNVSSVACSSAPPDAMPALLTQTSTRPVSGRGGLLIDASVYSTDFSSTTGGCTMPGAVETEPIQYEVEGHVARIWLNRPHKLNSVSQQLLHELDDARVRAEEDDNVR